MNRKKENEEAKMAPESEGAHQEEKQEGLRVVHQEVEEKRDHPPGMYQRWDEDRKDASHQT